MDKSIEELRAQRDLIKKHLDWLDHKLAEAESRPSGDGPPAPTAEPETLIAATAPTAAAALTATTPETAATPANPTAETSSESPELILDPERILAAPPPMDLRRAKIGCLVFFAVASFLFLFLLFGLPYLID